MNATADPSPGTDTATWPALRVQGLAVTAGEQALVAGLSLDVRTGEIVALVGPSGSGKTTALRSIAGLIQPAAGTVHVAGRSGDEIGWPAFRRRVVLLDQRPVLLEGTVRQNLARPFAYRTARGVFPGERARDLLIRVGVEPERIDQEARSLSVGQQQRVCLVRALLVEPEVLLMDEPTSALDAASVRAVEGLIAQHAGEHGLACLAVTHDLGQVERWCSRAIDLQAYRPPGAPPAQSSSTTKRARPAPDRGLARPTPKFRQEGQ